MKKPIEKKKYALKHCVPQFDFNFTVSTVGKIMRIEVAFHLLVFYKKNFSKDTKPDFF